MVLRLAIKNDTGELEDEIWLLQAQIYAELFIAPTVTDELIEQARAKADIQAVKFAPGKRSALINRIKDLLQRENAVLVAHYYTAPELKQLAYGMGGHVADSLDMAGFASEHPATTLVVAGVRFMGETAKILNPEKRILMPDKDASCNL